MSERRSNPEESSIIKEAKQKFRGDYANAFSQIDLFFQGLNGGMMKLNEFRNECDKIFNKNKKELVLKFSDRYPDLPIPEFYEIEITQLDMIVDKINTWAEDFLQNPDNEKIVILQGLVKEGINIIKKARVR